jgi:2-polyprenyl-6-methoxyphenol hydroxylase-like FAD-dependent oxidoreductase
MNAQADTPIQHSPVLIVGGGIVGLSAALFLLHHGITPLLVERHSGPSIHPRARGVNARTMELYRELGLEEAIREAGAALAPAIGIHRGASLAQVLADAQPWPARHSPFAPADEMSPASGCRCTQDLLEPVLLAAARERGGDIRFGTALASFAQDESGVTATIIDRATEEETTVRAPYMIAADGARSGVREALGVPMSGRGSLGHLLNILFRADLTEMVRGREFSICLIERPELHGLFASINNSDRWVFHHSYDRAGGAPPEEFTTERCIAIVREALGMPDAAITIESVLPWESAARVAESYRRGRILLAGDAAHLMPPWGGLGANTGVQDVHNLAWKLALVLKGRADRRLLDTYEEERAPVAREAAEDSAALADERGILAYESFMSSIAARLATIGGYHHRYESRGVIAADDDARTAPPKLDGSPGTRAPHAWVEHRGARVSTLDLLGSTFVLLAGEGAGAWCHAAEEAAAHAGIDIAACRVGPSGEAIDADGNWRLKAGIDADGALLVRPDGFVAWRSRGASEAPVRELECVLYSLLCDPDAG